MQYCITHDHNYIKTFDQFEISYQQARNYTIKYEKQGVRVLRDRREKQKTEAEMSELEKLREENRILRSEKNKEHHYSIRSLYKLDINLAALQERLTTNG